MFPEVIAILASIVCLCVSVVIRPVKAACPTHWYVNGIRPSGEFSCRPVPAIVPSEERPPYKPLPLAPIDDVEFKSRIYCSGGFVPVVLGGREVGCRRVE